MFYRIRYFITLPLNNSWSKKYMYTWQQILTARQLKIRPWIKNVVACTLIFSFEPGKKRSFFLNQFPEQFPVSRWYHENHFFKNENGYNVSLWLLVLKQISLVVGNTRSVSHTWTPNDQDQVSVPRAGVSETGRGFPVLIGLLVYMQGW